MYKRQGYIPLSLWFHAKMLLQRSEALRNTQHFTIDEKGVTISQDGEEALFCLLYTSLIAKYHITLISVGNGTASRESEQIIH